MTSAAYNHFMTTNDFQKFGNNIKITYLDITGVLSPDRKEIQMTGQYGLKRSTDKAAKTKSSQSDNWVKQTNIAEFIYNFKQDFVWRDGILWMNMRLFDRVIGYLFKRITAIQYWLDGLKDWQKHLFEFIYIRCDPKFRLTDWIIKGGREMDPYGRDANYQQHSSKNGCDTVYWLFVVAYGSPAETKLKEMFGKYFKKPEKVVNGKKTGVEHYLVPDVSSEKEFIDIIDDVACKFYDAMDEEEEMIDCWYHDSIVETKEEFILRYMPWARVKKTKN